MHTFLRIRNFVVNIIIGHRWLLLLLLGAAVLIFELLENYNVENPVDGHFVRELLFFGAIYPLVTLLLLNKLLSVQSERNSIAWQQQRSRQLKQDLMQAQDLEELYQIVITFPESIAPVIGAVLLRPAPENAVLEIAAERWLVGAERPPSLATVNYDFCGAAEHIPGRGLHPFLFQHTTADFALHGYCLPLFRADQVLGLLHLYLPAAKHLTSDQINILNQTGSAMALALGSAVAQNAVYLQAVAAHHERERIARHLHDTLGQSLAYLQVKLTKFTTDNMLVGISVIQQDLERMRDIANEAYEQVRQTVLAMQADDNHNLTDALVAQAKAMAGQAGLELHFFVDGPCQPLPSLVQRKILFIFREAWNNVWRHAQATAVDLTITWDTNSVTVNLNDDGAGFDIHEASNNGHFGLLIMAQRAEEIKGDLSVTSAPNRGTHVCLRYPLSSRAAGQP